MSAFTLTIALRNMLLLFDGAELNCLLVLAHVARDGPAKKHCQNAAEPGECVGRGYRDGV